MRIFTTKKRIAVGGGLTAFVLISVVTVIMLVTGRNCDDIYADLHANLSYMKAKEKHGTAPLQWVAANGSSADVKSLIECGENVNSGSNENDFTPLHYASNVDVARLLIANGADVNAMTAIGTPLHLTAEKNSADVAKLLIAHGAYVNARTSFRHTPLHLAAFSNSLDVAKLLIASGANINQQSQLSGTPLNMAASNNSIEVAQLLLVHGADVNAKSLQGFGQTPLETAIKKGHAEMVALIEKYQY